MGIPILKIWNKITNQYESILAIKGDKGDTPQKGVDYFTDADIQEVINEVLLNIPNTSAEIFVTRYQVMATYKVGTYTDVDFNIYKEGYTPISIIPRTSGHGDVLVLGYGFYDNGGQGDVDYSKATVTFRSISSNQVTGGAKLEVIYIKNG